MHILRQLVLIGKFLEPVIGYTLDNHSARYRRHERVGGLRRQHRADLVHHFLVFCMSFRGQAS